MQSIDSVRGSQQPRISVYPAYVKTYGPEALELAALAGLYADPWQEDIVTHTFGVTADGKWAAPTVGLEVARQNGKGSVLEIIELAGMFLLDERLIIHTAHLQGTATSHFMRMLQLIEGVPEFERRVMAAPRGKGSEAIRLRGGQEIKFTTRARGGGRGLTADRIVYDEAMYLSEQDRAALTPTMAAQSMRGNTQTLYTGSATDQQDTSQDGVPFTQVRQAALSGAEKVAYFEFSADLPDWMARHGLRFDPYRPEIEQITPDFLADPENWAQANPSLGIRIAHTWVHHELTVGMGPRAFAVERLGIGDRPDISEDGNWVIPKAVWDTCACRDDTQRIVSHKTFAVDVNPDRTWGSIGVAGKRPDANWHGALVDHQRGTDWILQRAHDLSVEHGAAPFVILARGPAAPLIQPFKDAGLEVVEASMQDYAIACGGFFDDVVHRHFRWPAPQPELDAALAAARKDTSEAWRWSPKRSTSADISPLVAVTLAEWGAKTHEPEPKPVPMVAVRRR